MKLAVNSIETLGAVDGPGVRVVVFLSGCSLRCKYCHNPEMFKMGEPNFTPEELVSKLVRYKPYFKSNNGGVTFSGGEPLMQTPALLETCKLLKQEGIHIALDTAGQSSYDYKELLEYVDLILYDIKDITESNYKYLTNGDIAKTHEFLSVAKSLNKKFWIRQVVVPNLHDNIDFITNLSTYIKTHFDTTNIERIEFLPYHKLGSEKYLKMNLKNPYLGLIEMDKEKCDNLYKQFMSIYEK